MIKVDGSWFKDEHGRTLILRGVNLGGSSKVPFRPDGSTHISEGFFDHRKVSFVGRPFPLDEADEHFSRLHAWGLRFLRFLVTWEAIEHAGPGIYDEEYLDYLCQVVRRAGEHGIDLFIDPHQDTWSRFSGGDGAPGWTFEALGMDVRRFAVTGAAIVHCLHGDPYPRMIWPTNYSKLAAATMFTLFFGGNDFAPNTKVEGESAQEFLQGHYLRAVQKVAERLSGLPNVIGYDTMNEPSAGYIGCEDLGHDRSVLKLGEAPSPYQSMLLGAGFPQEVEVWELTITGPKMRGRRLLNAARESVWLDGKNDIWVENGVWELDPAGSPQLKRPHHFASLRGRPVDFANDYLRPFINRYAQAIRSVDPEAIIFVEGEALSGLPIWEEEDARDVVNASHWYDPLTLMMKRYTPHLTWDIQKGRLVIGRKRVMNHLVGQLAAIKTESEMRTGGVPTLIGEFGIPFDMHSGRAYETGDFSRQAEAMDASYRAVDANLLNACLWNYTADNDNVRGDRWNGEDLSIFSRDQQDDVEDLNSGGRGLEAVVRPYAVSVAGEPLRMSFERKRRRFLFEFRHDPQVGAPTEVFVPMYQYPRGYAVSVSDGAYERDEAGQLLSYRHGFECQVHRIEIVPLDRR